MEDDGLESTQKSRRPSRMPWVLVGLFLAWAGAATWFGMAKVTEEKAKTAAAIKESSEAAERLKALEAKSAALEAERKALAAQASSLTEDLKAKEAELDKLKATYDSLEDKMKAEISRGDIQLSQVGGKIRVDLVDKVLFDSGEAELSARGKEVLSRLGGVLAGIADKQIQVSGHTDDSGIADKLKATFPTNWELSAARAVNVVRFLSEEAGVPPARLMAAGYGPYHPVSTNANAAGRAKNRRIEVLLTPMQQAEAAKLPVAAAAPPVTAPAAKVPAAPTTVARPAAAPAAGARPTAAPAAGARPAAAPTAGARPATAPTAGARPAAATPAATRPAVRPASATSAPAPARPPAKKPGAAPAPGPARPPAKK